MECKSIENILKAIKDIFKYNFIFLRFKLNLKNQLHFTFKYLSSLFLSSFSIKVPFIFSFGILILADFLFKHKAMVKI